MVKVDLDLIQKLRDRTGVGMMDCKKALVEADGDIEKAVEILRKKGAAVAEKRAGNTTAEGLIHAYIHPGARLGVLLQLSCETDFVARTADMKQFAQDVCMHIAALKPRAINSSELDREFIERERAIFRDQLIKAGKPEKMVDQILEGKLQKVYAEVCLLDQTFIKNDKITVSDLLKDLIAKMGENIKITRFAQFEVGS